MQLVFAYKMAEVEFFSDEEIETKETFEPEKINNIINIENENEIKPIIKFIALKKTVSRPENINGYTIAYVDSVLYSVSNRTERVNMEGLIYAILDDEELFDFINTQDPPIDKGYSNWDCPEMEKIKELSEMHNHTGFTFGLLCRNVQLFFRQPQKFFDTFIKL